MTHAANANFLSAERINPHDIRITGREHSITRLFEDLKNSGATVFRLTSKCIQLSIPESRRAEFDAKGDKWEFEYK